MPQLGDIKRARDLGYKGRDKHIWAACSECGRERWVLLRLNILPKKCWACATKQMGLAFKCGEENPRWNGGRFKTTDGYIAVKLQPNDPFYPMATKRGYVLEHRLIMAKHLGRCLLDEEVVHHDDDNGLNNSFFNLILFISTAVHSALHMKAQSNLYLKSQSKN